MVYEVWWLQDVIVAPSQLWISGYLFETPDDMWYSEYWRLIWDGAIDEARAFWKANSIRSGLGQGGRWTTHCPGRPEYVTHWGEAYKLAASVIGLPSGAYRY